MQKYRVVDPKLFVMDPDPDPSWLLEGSGSGSGSHPKYLRLLHTTDFKNTKGFSTHNFFHKKLIFYTF
jgi:hypothetical protein